MPGRRIGQPGVDLAGEFVSALPGPLRGRTDTRRRGCRIGRPPAMASPYTRAACSPCPAHRALGGDWMRPAGSRPSRARGRGPTRDLGPKTGDVSGEFFGEDELVGRPRRLVMDLRSRARSSDQVGRQVQRLIPGQQRAIQHRSQGRRGWAGAGQMGDASGGGVRLLRGETSVLHRQVSYVAGGENPPIGIAHPAPVIDRDEPIDGLAGNATQVRPGDRRQGHDPVRVQVDVTGLQTQPPRPVHVGPGPRVQRATLLGSRRSCRGPSTWARVRVCSVIPASPSRPSTVLPTSSPNACRYW